MKKLSVLVFAVMALTLSGCRPGAPAGFSRMFSGWGAKAVPKMPIVPKGGYSFPKVTPVVVPKPVPSYPKETPFVSPNPAPGVISKPAQEGHFLGDVGKEAVQKGLEYGWNQFTDNDNKKKKGY